MNNSTSIIADTGPSDNSLPGKGRLLVAPIIARDLKPGDLFSTKGSEYWRFFPNFLGVGQGVYLRTADTRPTGDEHTTVYRLRTVREQNLLEAARQLLSAYIANSDRGLPYISGPLESHAEDEVAVRMAAALAQYEPAEQKGGA